MNRYHVEKAEGGLVSADPSRPNKNSRATSYYVCDERGRSVAVYSHSRWPAEAHAQRLNDQGARTVQLRTRHAAVAA